MNVIISNILLKSYSLLSVNKRTHTHTHTHTRKEKNILYKLWLKYSKKRKKQMHAQLFMNFINVANVAYYPKPNACQLESVKFRIT